ncbi:hypothetical protein HYV84_06500 [Candidatus Woesearchaeota archaeon]|nr:hypothetical protein [Candidatus Woesearchaeota archaeon]
MTLGNKKAAVLIIGLIGLWSLVLFGLPGVRLALGSILLFFVPAYLLLSRLTLSIGEKIVFSLFLGFVLFASVAYWLGVIMPFRLAIWFSFAILIGAGLFLRKRKRSSLVHGSGGKA